MFPIACLLYTSDAADEEDSVDLVHKDTLCCTDGKVIYSLLLSLIHISEPTRPY